MDRNNSFDQRALDNLIDSIATEKNIYITATKTRALDGEWRSTTRFHLLFGVIHRAHSDTNPTSEVQLRSTSWCFYHPFDRFASAERAKSAVASMLSDLGILILCHRDRAQCLHWKEVMNDNDSSAVAAERVPLQGFDDLVTRITEAAVRAVCEASASGCKIVEMAITIDKRTVVPHQQFERFIPYDAEISPTLDHEKPKLYLELIEDHYFVLSRYHFFSEPRVLSSAIKWSPWQWMRMFWSVPATKPAVETLEKSRCGRSSKDHEDESKLTTCVICMEVVMCGARLTRLPCSHLYHSDCISEWLRRNPACPICRYKLPATGSDR